MRNSFKLGMLSALMIAFITVTVVSVANAGLLRRDSEPSGLQKQELDDAYYRGYNDAKNGKEPVDYTAGGAENNGQVVRGAGRGARGGAARGNLSDGDAGKGAAWGAGAGAIKGVIKKKRAAEEEKTWASELSGAYNSGYRKGMAEKTPVNVKAPAQQ
jgi:hypothetical protein